METDTRTPADRVREKLGRLSDEALSTAWLATATRPASRELALVRKWMIEELKRRMSPQRYDAWLFADGEAVDPLPFLAG